MYRELQRPARRRLASGQSRRCASNRSTSITSCHGRRDHTATYGTCSGLCAGSPARAARPAAFSGAGSQARADPDVVACGFGRRRGGWPPVSGPRRGRRCRLWEAARMKPRSPDWNDASRASARITSRRSSKNKLSLAHDILGLSAFS